MTQTYTEDVLISHAGSETDSYESQMQSDNEQVFRSYVLYDGYGASGYDTMMHKAPFTGAHNAWMWVDSLGETAMCLDAVGGVSFFGGLSCATNMQIGAGLEVGGNTEIEGTLDVAGSVDIGGQVHVAVNFMTAILEYASSSDTGTARRVLQLKHSTQASAALGFGPVLEFAMEDSSAAERSMAKVQAMRTNGDQCADLIFSVANGGSPAEALRLTQEGYVRFGGLATENLEVQDAGSSGATEQDWVEVTVGGNTGYFGVYSSK